MPTFKAKATIEIEWNTVNAYDKAACVMFVKHFAMKHSSAHKVNIKKIKIKQISA